MPRGRRITEQEARSLQAEIERLEQENKDYAKELELVGQQLKFSDERLQKALKDIERLRSVIKSMMTYMDLPDNEAPE